MLRSVMIGDSGPTGILVNRAREPTVRAIRFAVSVGCRRATNDIGRSLYEIIRGPSDPAKLVANDCLCETSTIQTSLRRGFIGPRSSPVGVKSNSDAPSSTALARQRLRDAT
jgi:hypothetical protein